MMRLFYSVLLVAFALRSTSLAHSTEDMVRWSQSDDWRVRYCVPMECHAASLDAKHILEKLSLDEDRRVARQAFAVYSQLFVDVDKSISRKAFDRGDFVRVGIEVTNVSVFSTTEFWSAQLASSNESVRGGVVQAIGLLHDVAALPKLIAVKGSKNPYALLELAKAFRRLGNDKEYLTVLDSLLTPSISDKESIYYRTRAIDCLIETHPARARAAWELNDQALARVDDVQPNWMFAHVTQKQRLP